MRERDSNPLLIRGSMCCCVNISLQCDRCLIDVASHEEVYYPAFEGAVEAGVGSMMCARLRAVAVLWNIS